MMPIKVLLVAAVFLSGCHLYTELDPVRSEGDRDAGADAASSDATQVGPDAMLDMGTDVLDSPDVGADMMETPGIWKFVASGTVHTCALTQDGTAYCWGAGGNLQLGNGARDNVATPVLVQTDLKFTALALGSTFSCGLAEQQLFCWGELVGESSEFPVLVDEGPYERIEATDDHGCGMRTDSTVRCWGENGFGQLGDGTTNDSPTPVAFAAAPDENPTDFAVGDQYTCALFADRIECMGVSLTITRDDTPVREDVDLPLPAEGATKIFGGFRHLCVLDGEQHVQCIGGAEYITTERDQTVPSVFGRLRNDVALGTVALSDAAGCGIDSAKHLQCWGANYRGRLGRGDEKNDFVGFPFGPTSSDQRYQQVSGGKDHFCALTTSGDIDCWGLGTYGRLGVNELGYTTTPHPIVSDRDFVEVELGAYHTCAREADGTVACWGRGNYFGLGNGLVTHQKDPVTVPGINAKHLTAGGSVVCVATNTDQVACWGRDGNNMLGNGSRSDSNVPDFLSAPAGPVLGISVGARVGCYWTQENSTGNIYCWGNPNIAFTGTSGTSPAPISLTPRQDFTTVSAGENHLCAINDVNEAYCWGYNNYGQTGVVLADTSRQAPQPVLGTPNSFLAVQVGDTFTCAIDSSNEIWCWGDRIRVPGLQPDGNPFAPLKIDLPGTFQKLVGQNQTMCAITTDGEMWCFGANVMGEGGNGTLGQITNPTKVNLPEAVTDGDGDAYAMCAVGVSGKVYCWGEQTFYRAGDHVFGMRLDPTPIITPADLL
ncbi:MAG: hypothetical protein R3E66_18480 [bacterium]